MRQSRLRHDDHDPGGVGCKRRPMGNRRLAPTSQTERKTMYAEDLTAGRDDEIILATNALRILLEMRAARARISPTAIKALAAAVQILPSTEFSSDRRRPNTRADAWLAICALGVEEARRGNLDTLIERAIAKTRFWIDAVKESESLLIHSPKPGAVSPSADIPRYGGVSD
jgi:hypothetical protein